MRPFVEQNLIFMTIAGSHSYGTSTADSDVDKRGVCVPPKNVVMGFANRFEQQDYSGEDTIVYSLSRFMQLASECNPNIIELLFAPPDCIQSMKYPWDKLLERKREFLTAQAYPRFSGYAASQLKRIKTHRAWLLNPPTREPTREDFDLPKYGTGVAEIAKGIDIGEISPEVLSLISREKAYKSEHLKWEQYENWKKTRNPARSTLEVQFGYDCYDSRTEFLTENGWLKYDDITDDVRLATINPTSLQIEWQLPFDRVSKEYNGPLYIVEDTYTKCIVTPNHRMFISDVHRKRSNNYSSAYNEELANWHFEPLSSLLDGQKSHYHIMNRATQSIDDWKIDCPSHLGQDEALRLMGAYISEGCVGKRLKNGEPSILRFSQKQGGRLCPIMEQISNLRIFYSNRNESWRKEPIIEVVWTLADREVAKWIANGCGIGSANKKLPSWTKYLSSRQAKILLDAMIAGDGTDRGQNRGYVYYTISQQLADDLQAMASATGFTTCIWGPYANTANSRAKPIYQISIRKARISTSTIQFSNSRHIEAIQVSNARVVCFSVPNETLVTRIDGKVSYQGNTKHAAHLVRLLRMGKQILTEGDLEVRRRDAGELLAIRNGKWTYDELMAYVDPLCNELETIYQEKKYVVPDRVDVQKLSDFCVELHEMYWDKYGNL